MTNTKWEHSSQGGKADAQQGGAAGRLGSLGEQGANRWMAHGRLGDALRTEDTEQFQILFYSSKDETQRRFN